MQHEGRAQSLFSRAQHLMGSMDNSRRLLPRVGHAVERGEHCLLRDEALTIQGLNSGQAGDKLHKQ